jgi:predicted nucleic acid-binding protein
VNKDLFSRALELSREIEMGGYDALYLAHAEALRIPWLTADGKVLRRLGNDERVRALQL